MSTDNLSMNPNRPRVCNETAMRRIIRTSFCAVVALAWSSVSHAQDVSPYVGGSLMASQWGSHDISGGSPSTTYYNTEVDTWLAGSVIEAGVRVNRRWSGGVEFAQPFQRVEMTNVYPYFRSPAITEVRYRETSLLGVARMDLPTVGNLRPAVIGGIAKATRPKEDDVDGAEPSLTLLEIIHWAFTKTAQELPLSPPPQVHGFLKNSREFVVSRLLVALANFSEIRGKNTDIEKRRRSW